MAFDSHSDPDLASEEVDWDDDESLLSLCLSETLSGPDADTLRDEVAQANGRPGFGARLIQINHCIEISLPLIEMNPLARQAAGLSEPLPLKLTLDLSAGIHRMSPSPLVSVSYGAPEGVRLRTSSFKQDKEFVVGLQLVQAVQKYLDRTWQHRDASFWPNLCALADKRLLNGGDTCILCDEALTHPGFKPTVCESPLCCFQMDSLGIGSSLNAFIDTPLVADLLLLTTAAAATLAVRHRPGCMPTTPALATGQLISPAALASRMAALPKFEEIAKAVSDGKNLATNGRRHDALSPDVARTLRWILSTNRAHLTHLSAQERLAGMSCEWQFKIHTSTRSHARSFEALKAAHGSFFAFHGSPLGNWHNILRNNLQNMSGSAMMSTGALYGQGIYLTESSLTSLTYTASLTGAPASGWSGSLFGEHVRVLALCEVVNSPTLIRGRQTGIIVSPDAKCVTLRYLFVIKDNGSHLPRVNARSLQLQRYRNETTIASMEPIAELPPERLLVTSDQYAWDIEEVVAMVRAKQGLFINSYTQQSFAPPDVRAILDHHSGAGVPLRQIETQNAALRRQISPSTLAFLRKTGSICRNDQSIDFAPSGEALVALTKFLNDLPEQERTALRLASFSATDSQSGSAMRDTVDSALTLALSAGACIHRFGDFLSQLQY